MNRHIVISATRRALTKKRLGRVHPFGSAMHSMSGNSDIDLIVVASRRRVRFELQEAKLLFERKFNRRLHIQLFYPHQVHQILSFFRRCGPRFRCL